MKPLYVVAVSGGVDSVVLLHQLVLADEARLVVAHVDHGIRQESGKDAAFVEKLTAGYGVPFESVRLHLGPDASEALARKKRWEFLRAMKEKYAAAAIVTAHHADDVVETMIINLMRGTGWRGLASLNETGEVKRPFLGMRKSMIIGYARQHGLQWQEDATNQDKTYLRNHIRHDLLAKCSEEDIARFLQLNKKQQKMRQEIEREVSTLTPALRRYDFVMWPDEVALEMVRAQVGALTHKELERILLFIRVSKNHKKIPLSNGKILRMDVNQFIVLEGEG